MPKTTSVESELRALVSVCDGDQTVSGAILSVLHESHFASSEASEIYTRIDSLIKKNKPIPKVVVLQNDPALSHEAREILSSGIEVCSDEDDAKAVNHQLEHYRKLRVIYKGTQEVVKSMNDPSPDTVDKALNTLERTVLQARSDYEDTKLVISGDGSNARPLVQSILTNEYPDRVKTGFKRFDEASGGFARKDLVLIAANTGGGKSVMAEQLAINGYFSGHSVALVSFEMDEEEIYARLLANLANAGRDPGKGEAGIKFEDIYLRRLSKKQQAVCERIWESFNKHGEVNGCKFVVWCPTVDVNPTQVGAVLKPGGFDEILVDYVGLVAAEKEAALWENLGEITKGFKGVARRNDCVLVVFAQLDEDTNKVKYSKAMRHHSSYVWKWQYGEEQDETGQIIVEQEKTRHCKRFNFPLMTDFETMRFIDPKGEGPGIEDVSSKEEAERKKADFSGQATAEQTAEMLEEARRKRRSYDDDEDEDESENEDLDIADIPTMRMSRNLTNMADPTDEDDL